MIFARKIKVVNKYNNYNNIIFLIFFIQFILSCKDNNYIQFNEKGIYGAFFNDKYQKQFIGNGKGELFIVDNDFKIVDKKQFAYGPVATCISSPDNNYMINTSGDGTLYIWKVYKDSLILFYKNKIHNSASMTCLFSPLMNYAVSTGHDSTVVVLDWKNKYVSHQLKSPHGTIRFAWFTYDDKFLLWADDKGYFYKTFIETSKTQVYKITNCAINCIVTTLDNSEILTATDNGNMYVLDFSSLKIKQCLSSHNGAAFVAEYYNPNRTKIASSGYDGYLTFWKKNKKGQYHLLNKIKAHDSPCCTLYYNDDCTQLLSGGQDGYIKLWDSKSLKLLKSKYIYE